jgi:hypothetical protein
MGNGAVWRLDGLPKAFVEGVETSDRAGFSQTSA